MNEGENKQSTNSPEGTSDVDTQNPGGEDGSQLEDPQVDQLIDSLGDSKGEEGNKEEEEDDSSGEKKEGENTFHRKIGNREFTDPDEVVEFAKKNYGEVSRLMGENKKLQQKVNELQGDSQPVQGQSEQDDQGQDPQGQESGQLDDDALYWKFKTKEFYQENPDAKAYKDLMGTIIQSGRANVNGNPDLDVAYAKALRADGQKVPEHLVERLQAKTGQGGDNVKKRVMKSGGGVEGEAASEDDIAKSLGDFADKALLGL